MKLTNRFNLPEALVKAIANDSYDKGDCDFSVTELLKPPRITALEKRHEHELEEDVIDRLYSLYGQIAHLIIERANIHDFAEERLFAEIETIKGNFKVSGQVDTLSVDDKQALSDFKFSTAWKFKNNEAPEEWIAQLNMQLELLRLNGKDAKSLQIIGLIRDWSKPEARRNPEYPQLPIVVVPVPMWERSKTRQFMQERILMHLDARKNLPECSQEDRWAKDTQYAVMKKGASRATRLCASKQEAELIAKQQTDLGKGSFSVEERKGEAMRCAMYCSVSKFCIQFQKTLNQQDVKKVSGENG